MQATKKGLFNIFYGIIGQMVVIAFSIITPILAIHAFGSETNGLLQSAEQIFTYLNLFEAGVGYATLQALYKPVAVQDQSRISGIMAATKIYYTRTGIFYSLGIVVMAFLYPVIVSTNIPYMTVAGVILLGGLGGSFFYFYQGKYILLMQAEGYSFVTQKINILINILTSVAKIALLLTGFNVIAVQVSFFLFQGLRAVCYHFYVKKHYGNSIDFSMKPDFEAVSQKSAVFIHQLSTVFFSCTDILLLTFLIQDLKVVSVYTIYNYIIITITTLAQTISGGFDFRLGQIWATDREQYGRLYHVFEIFHLTLIFSLISALYIIFLPFITLYTKNVVDINYVHTWYPLLFVLAPLLTHGRTAAVSSVTFAGHFRQTKRFPIIESIINLTVSVVAILCLGLPGALVGTIVASVYRTIAQTQYYYRHIVPGNAWHSLKRWIACFGLFALLVLLVWVHPFRFDSYIQIAIAALVSGGLSLLIYGGALYLINPGQRKLLLALASDLIKTVLARLRGKERGNEA